jgi:hypothetical protein
MFEYKYADLKKSLMEFGRHMPERLDWAVKNRQSYDIKCLCNRLDYLEFHYIQYLTYKHKTLHRIFYEARLAKKTVLFKLEYVTMILDEIESYILKSELYELMPRFLNSKKSLLKMLYK